MMQRLWVLSTILFLFLTQLTIAKDRVGIIGGSAAGIVTAWLLDGQAEVTLFETSDHLGGDTLTVPGEKPNHAGYERFNKADSPRFLRLLKALQVPLQEFEVSGAPRFSPGRLKGLLKRSLGKVPKGESRRWLQVEGGMQNYFKALEEQLQTIQVLRKTRIELIGYDPEKQVFLVKSALGISAFDKLVIATSPESPSQLLASQFFKEAQGRSGIYSAWTYTNGDPHENAVASAMLVADELAPVAPRLRFLDDYEMEDEYPYLVTRATH